MKQTVRELKAAFPHTLPVLTGFLFLGAAYGILMNSEGYGIVWAVSMSLLVFAGSAQYAAVTALTTAFNPVSALLLTLMINARHLFYGISMLDRYRDAGWFKPYLIFGLCDETFSIVCSTEPPPGIDPTRFRFFITLLDHAYWVAGSAVGGLLGYMVAFDTNGLDFVLTALFVVIFIGQWRSGGNRRAAVAGLACSGACLLFFGPEHFIIPSMIAILAVLSLFRKRLEGQEAAA